MVLVNVDTSNKDLLKPYEPKLLPNGKHLFEVANDLVVSQAKPPSPNQIIKVELRCQDEDDNKGAVVFDNIVLIADDSTTSGKKAKEINEGRIAQFALACGVLTEEQIKAGEGLPLEQFVGRRGEAITKVESSKDANTQQIRQNSKISRYLFEIAKKE